jgi:hypothetical protein
MSARTGTAKTKYYIFEQSSRQFGTDAPEFIPGFVTLNIGDAEAKQKTMV